MLKKNDIYQLHQKYSHGVFKDKIVELVWTHSLIVEEMALQLADNLKKKHGIEVDRSLISMGAAAHDIGFYNCFDDNFIETKKYFYHAFEGYLNLKKEGVEEKIARFALVHTGVGVTYERAMEAKLPENLSYVPVSIEKELVTYADCFHTKRGFSFVSFEEIEKHIGEKRAEDLGILYRFREKYGLPDIKSLDKKYESFRSQYNEWAKATNNE